MSDIFEPDDEEETEDEGGSPAPNTNNRFLLLLRLRVLPNKTLKPVDHKRDSHYTIALQCENPTYESELAAKKEATTYNEFYSLYYVDHDQIAEWRVRHCLVKWNFHRVLPKYTCKLIRVNGQLDDESWAAIKKLSPLVRKAIFIKIWDALGNP